MKAKFLIAISLVTLITATSARAEEQKLNLPAGGATIGMVTGCAAGAAWGWGPKNPTIDKGLIGCGVGMAVGGAAGYYGTKALVDSYEAQAPEQDELNQADE